MKRHAEIALGLIAYFLLAVLVVYGMQERVPLQTETDKYKLQALEAKRNLALERRNFIVESFIQNNPEVKQLHEDALRYDSELNSERARVFTANEKDPAVWDLDYDKGEFFPLSK